MTFKSYLKLYIIISPKKQGYGITTDTAAVHSSMHCSLENVIFSTFNLLIVNGTKERHERTWPSSKLIAEAVETMELIVSVRWDKA